MLLKQVVLIGAGNVGYHLGHCLQQNGIKIVQVFSRQADKAKELATQLKCDHTTQLDQIVAVEHCLYLIAVRDDAIEQVAKKLTHLSHADRLFVHTSGAVSSQVLGKHFKHFGVFYPLQTFSKDRAVDFSSVPICVYAPDQKLSDTLIEFGERISKQVQQVDDHQRSVLHVAAVFVNNFSNHLFGIGQKLVAAENLSFDLLRPLIAETAAKVIDHDPTAMQTGPASRRDQKTILSHLRFLQKHPDYQHLYRAISHSIAEKKS